MTAQLGQESPPAVDDPFPVRGMDACVFAVGNATQAAHYYSTAFGMRCVAYRGPETGNRDHAELRAAVGLAPGSSLTGAVRRRAPGSADARRRARRRRRRHRAARCPTSTRPTAHAVARGATGLVEPHDVSDEHGTVRLAAIATYGDTRHTLVDRSGYTGAVPARLRRRGADSSAAAGQALLPGDRPLRRQRRARPDGRVGRLLQAGHGLHQHGGVRRRRHRHRVLGADVQGRRQRQPQGQVPAQRAGGRASRSRRSTSTSSSTAARASSTSRWPPTTSCATVDAMRGQGVRVPATRRTPTTTTLRCEPGSARSGCRSRSCRSVGILVDRDEDGYLLQIFTKPVADRPTVFFELIERHGSLGLRQGQLQGAVRGDRARAGARGNL